MKSNIKSLLMAGGAMLALASCSENSWNNLYLDGFEDGYTATDVKTVSYTLTDNDYARIADNRFNKVLAEKNGVSSALASVKTQHYLNADIPGAEYIPNLLKDSLFTYFALSDGSAINLTYREVGELPAEMKALNGAQEYVVTEEDYQSVYGSDEDYATAFSPSYSASANIPSILAAHISNPEEGQYVIVNYNQADQDPNFGGSTTEFEMTDVLTYALEPGDMVKVNGVVTALCKAGIIVSDKAGSLLVYAKDFPYADFAVGDQVVAQGELGYYKNCLQLPYDGNVTVVGKQSVTYPTPVDFTPEYLIEGNNNEYPALGVYGTMTGTIKIDGNYINVMFGDRTDVRGSVYNITDDLKAQLVDGAVMTLNGYFTQTSTSGSTVNANIVVTSVSNASSKPAKGPRRVAAIASKGVNAAYLYNGSKWVVASDIVVVNPDEYAAMGMTYGNFQNDQPAEYLPALLKERFPYAQADAEKFVAYKYYSNGSTTYACAQWTFDGSNWYDAIASNGVQTVTNQFVRDGGVWRLDPSITLTLPAGKNQPLSTWFFQACVDWVLANVPDGAEYVTSYGNNDYYTGASAYQGNIDLRAGSAKNQTSLYDGMTDDEVVALMKKHFEDEVGPGVLSVLYPDLAPVGDFQPTVTINFYVYNGTSTSPATIIFKAVDKGKFEFVSCTWNAE